MSCIKRKLHYWIIGDVDTKEKCLLDSLPMMEKMFGKLYWITTDHHTGRRIYEFDKAAFRFAVSTHAEEVYRTDYFNGYFDPACMKIIPMQYRKQLYPQEKLKR